MLGTVSFERGGFVTATPSYYSVFWSQCFDSFREVTAERRAFDSVIPGRKMWKENWHFSVSETFSAGDKITYSDTNHQVVADCALCHKVSDTTHIPWMTHDSPPIEFPRVLDWAVCCLPHMTSVWAPQGPSLGLTARHPPEASPSLPAQTVISAFNDSCTHVSYKVSVHLQRSFCSLYHNWFIINGWRLAGMVQKKKGEPTWSCLTCSWRACWVLAAICDACRNLVEHRCFSPSISSAQYLCLSSNSWQVSASFSSKLTCCMVNTAQ